jgi:hypothetical protein
MPIAIVIISDVRIIQLILIVSFNFRIHDSRHKRMTMLFSLNNSIRSSALKVL